MALMDRAATSRALSLELGSFVRQQTFARTVQRCLQQYELSARRPWLRLLTLHHNQHQNGRIHVWWHPDECTWAACIRLRHTGPSPGVMTYPDTKNVRLFPLPARSPDLSPIETVWSIVAERLARHHTADSTVDELWHHVEAAWTSVPVHAIQSLFDSIPRRKVLLLLPEVVVLGTDFSRSMHPNFLKI
ncbi:transposable element Tcb1 transposase [Trichonephila clavipes]|nr:transposable element Tcb1 transposase [Trichonephila clavipes]